MPDDRAESSPVSSVDVLVVGGGLVGLALAAAVAPSGLSVAVVDRVPFSRGPTPEDDEDWDSRIYAISPGSAAFLRSIGAWQQVPCGRVQAIETMRVLGDAGTPLAFSAYELGERALAWIVEERSLREALRERLLLAGIPLLAPRSLASIGWSAAAATVQFREAPPIAARLVVGADGLRSRVRECSGIIASPIAYRQTAVVANFSCERAHHGRATQWFRRDGSVLAWLPLPGRRISIVWSAPEPLAEELLAGAGATLAARVGEAGGGALGELRLLTPPMAFPLAHLVLPRIVGPRLALVGDAAHGVHPLAGQGVNLGFGDAEVLAGILRNRGIVADVGTPFLLERYARRRAEPVRSMHLVTDGLVRLFAADTWWVRQARNIGLGMVDRLAPAKRLLARAALR